MFEQLATMTVGELLYWSGILVIGITMLVWSFWPDKE